MTYWKGTEYSSNQKYYIATADAPSSSVKLKIEAAEGGYYLTYNLNGNKKYINAVIAKSSKKTFYNLDITDTASSVWEYDAEYNTFLTSLDSKKYYIGSFGSNNYFRLSETKHLSDSYPAHFYDVEITDYNFDHPNSGGTSSPGTNGGSTTYEPFTDTVDTGDLVEHYASCKGKTGETLFKELQSVSKKGFHNMTYEALYQNYKITDIRPDGTICDIYSNFTKYKPGAGSGNKEEGDGYNREHSTPKSWWGGEPEKSQQGSDAFIVYPSDCYVNAKRSNFCFGEVGTIDYASKNSYSLLGKSKLPGYSGKVFEPNDQWKGDLARSAFYALVAWSGSYGWTVGDGKYIYSGSLSKNFGLTDYARELYVRWAHEDPVDEWEKQRNTRVQSVQGNRNPFIDHPEYIDAIWGN